MSIASKFLIGYHIIPLLVAFMALTDPIFYLYFMDKLESFLNYYTDPKAVILNTFVGVFYTLGTKDA